ncbi:hypothetical protein [Lacticaseibacillus zhaodongensis]|uniref:hypothetical protein n=1 Tax=Lacticaseibacillus zhaodongensis TaxID=2668065 RepID=UPI0012D363B9|nr:hypothetical protein [Lacticaseibacillus zhaodongensis]
MLVKESIEGRWAPFPGMKLAGVTMLKRLLKVIALRVFARLLPSIIGDSGETAKDDNGSIGKITENVEKTRRARS